MFRDFYNDIKEDSFWDGLFVLALGIMMVLSGAGAIYATILLFVNYPLSILGIIGVVLGLMLITWLIRRYG